MVLVLEEPDDLLPQAGSTRGARNLAAHAGRETDLQHPAEARRGSARHHGHAVRKEERLVHVVGDH